MNTRRLPHAVLILAVFAVAARMQSVAAWIPGYRELYDRFPFYVPESLRSVAEILLVFVVVAAIHRLGPGGVLRELGLLQRPFRGLVFAMLAALPLWAVFGATMPLASGIDPWAVAYLAGLSPLAEEVVFRAFAFGQLRRRLGWGFWWAALAPALVFGLVHLRPGQGPGQVAGVFLITAGGALLFSFVYERWGYDLWAAWGLHAIMNLAWNLFQVGDSAFADWLPTAMQAVTAASAVALTVWRHRLPVLGDPLGEADLESSR
jgi:uncharacterized protein